MDDKSDVTVIAIKTVSGEDVLGLYAGDIDLEYSADKAMMIYRPIKIELITSYLPEGVMSNYTPKFYFPYGEVLTPIPYRCISHQELANPFFSNLYKKLVGEMVLHEEGRQARISKAYEKQELEEDNSSTNSIYFDAPPQEYLQ
jgi:hypothetical protein